MFVPINKQAASAASQLTSFSARTTGVNAKNKTEAGTKKDKRRFLRKEIIIPPIKLV